MMQQLLFIVSLTGLRNAYEASKVPTNDGISKDDELIWLGELINPLMDIEDMRGGGKQVMGITWTR